jgi:hypothetical protein
LARDARVAACTIDGVEIPAGPVVLLGSPAELPARATRAWLRPLRRRYAIAPTRARALVIADGEPVELLGEVDAVPAEPTGGYRDAAPMVRRARGPVVIRRG